MMEFKVMPNRELKTGYSALRTETQQCFAERYIRLVLIRAAKSGGGSLMIKTALPRRVKSRLYLAGMKIADFATMIITTLAGLFQEVEDDHGKGQFPFQAVRNIYYLCIVIYYYC